MNAKRVDTKRGNTKRMRAWTGIALVLAVLSALCLSAVAQETADDWFKKSQDYWAIGSLEETAKALDKAIEINSSNATIWVFRGYTFLNIASKANHSGISTSDLSKYNESLNESLKSFDKALELNPKDKGVLRELWRGKGDVLAQMSEYEEAIKAFDKSLEIDPQWIPTLNDKGRVLTKMGKKTESVEAYDKSLETLDMTIRTADSTKNLSEAWLEKGFALQDQGRYEEAVKALDNSTNIDPKNEMAWKIKGVLLTRELGRHLDAIDAFDKALQLNPKDPLTWMNKGDALKALGRQAEADSAYAKARELGYKG
jgi:tetratricopeptide (TPR) repeat protein